MGEEQFSKERTRWALNNHLEWMFFSFIIYLVRKKLHQLQQPYNFRRYTVLFSLLTIVSWHATLELNPLR